MSLPISSIGLRYRNALWSACSASLYSRNALSIAFASAGVMNDDITAQATASRQIAQRLRACRRNCPTTAARRSAALLRLTVSAKVAFSDRTVEQASAMCTVIVRSFWDGGYSSSLLRHEESCQYPQR